MGGNSSQAFYVPSGSTVRLRRPMRLATSERERLWKGIERFVNCGDDIHDFQNLGRAFPDLWPARIYYQPDSETHPPEPLTWHPACHRLFLLYRDCLRALWNASSPASSLREPEFLLGIGDYSFAFEEAKDDGTPWEGDGFWARYHSAWWHIRAEIPTAGPTTPALFLGMLWEYGEFCLPMNFLDAGNDFPKAFYLLFRQSWRARVCARCKLFFVARKPKQKFCGTACSGGSRLASKREWWHSAGKKKRKRAKQLRKRRRKVEGTKR